MASKITMQEYWKEVDSIANEIADETQEQDEDRNWAMDRLFEYVDGHEWIIYTWAYPWVLMHCENEDAVFESVGPQTTESYSDIMQKMAFYAFEQDVGAKLEEVLAERGID